MNDRVDEANLLTAIEGVTPDAPANAGRKQDGRYAPGHSGNRAGKKKGTRHRATLVVEALLHGQAENLTRTAISRALSGDMTALRICLDRIAPAAKDRFIAFPLPSIRNIEDHPRAVAAVLARMACGDLTPREGEAFISVIEQHRRSIEIGELESRVAALECK